MSRLRSSAPTVPPTEQATQQARFGIQCTLAGDYPKAIELFTQALLIAPENSDIYGNRCVARHRAGDRSGAIADCRKAAELYKRQGNSARHQYALRALARLHKTQSDIIDCSPTTEGHHSHA